MSGTILSFCKGFGRKAREPQPRNPVADHRLAEVRAYWEGLRSSDAPPLRDAINPRGIAGALEHVFMIERVAPGLARFRLAGSQITDLIGCEVRGMPITTLFDPMARDTLAPVLERVFAGSAIAHLDLEAGRGIGRPALSGRLLILPLMSRPGRIDLALGCLALDAPLGRAPRRFGITRHHVERLVLDPPRAQVAAGADTDAADEPASLSRAYGALRLVHSAH